MVDSRPFLCRDGWYGGRSEQGHTDDIEDIETDQQQAREQGTDEQITDRYGVGGIHTHIQLCLLIGR